MVALLLLLLIPLGIAGGLLAGRVQWWSCRLLGAAFGPRRRVRE